MGTVCCRFDQLRDLIPHKDKLDKAAFLQKTIDYICQLQVQPRSSSHSDPTSLAVHLTAVR